MLRTVRCWERGKVNLKVNLKVEILSTPRDTVNYLSLQLIWKQVSPLLLHVDFARLCRYEIGMLWQQIVRKCSIRVVSLKTNSLPQQIDSVDQLLMLIKMVKRSELRIDRKLFITVFFLLFIFNSNQK